MARRSRSAPTLTELLRAALREGPPLNQVEKATGLKRQALSKFVRGEQSLRLDLADKLAAYFGIESKFPGR